jgi:hypothetical protein
MGLQGDADVVATVREVEALEARLADNPGEG